MGQTQKLHSIVLHAHDVGEADRFCILLTKERGKIAARAYGVRKPKSRMGGSLLPMQEVLLTARDGSSGIHISDCTSVDDTVGTITLQGFLHATQCADVLLSLLEDDHPVPDVFALTQEFQHACRRNEVYSALPFTIQLLCTLGMLPLQHTHAIFHHLSAEECTFVEACMGRQWVRAQPPASGITAIQALCARILDAHGRKPLKAMLVASEM